MDDALFVQPLSGLVTTTKYEPTTLTVGFCWVEVNPFGPDHAKVAFGMLDKTEICTEVAVQVKSPLVAVADGMAPSPVTIAVAEFVQPFVGFVTTTV